MNDHISKGIMASAEPKCKVPLQISSANPSITAIYLRKCYIYFAKEIAFLQTATKQRSLA